MTVDEAIMKALKVNMGQKDDEKILIVTQHDKGLGNETDLLLRDTQELANRMCSVFLDNDKQVDMIDYYLLEKGDGKDVTPEVYDLVNACSTPDIAFFVTRYSLTHTYFRKHLTELGTRVASMPTFTQDMFEEGGPMSVDYDKIQKQADLIKLSLELNKYVVVRGPGTLIQIEVDTNLAHVSSGMLTKKGAYGNLPGIETYVVPVHGGDSFGHITIPKGWGGDRALKYPVKLEIEQGRFVDFNCEDRPYFQEEFWDRLFLKQDCNILAELGIGFNPNINAEYIAKHGWSLLTAEKIAGSAHFANGNSYSMGGKNKVDVHTDWVVPDVTINFFANKPVLDEVIRRNSLNRLENFAAITTFGALFK